MRHALLALLSEGATHGYELKLRLGRQFGPTWMGVNIGQIYTTLGRLERDQLVESCFVPQESRPDKKVYAITPAGREELRDWIVSPSDLPRLHHDLFLKLILASAPGVDAGVPRDVLIQRQRAAYLQLLRDLNNLTLGGERAEAEILLLEGTILHLRADLDWLDLLEQRHTTGVTP